ncbi:MAG: rod shape-determining protein RodA [Christensenellaceae bacterium]|jgi:rod shape determining protein RodA
MKKNTINRAMWKYVDWFLIIIICLIFLYGLVSLLNATASPFTGDESTLAAIYENLNLGSAQWQIIFFGIGIGAMFLIMLIDYQTLRGLTDYMYWLAVGMLVLVLAFGSEQNGASGWFMVGGRGIQPAEYGKIVIIIVLAKVLADKTQGHDEGIRHFRDIWPALWRFAIPAVLIMAQPDWGTAMVYAVVFIIMLFMAKTSWKVMLLLLVIAAACIPLLYLIMDEYQKLRFVTFLNPELDPEGAGLQVAQAKMAIGSGGMFGKGLFAPGSMSQLDYVPEKHNDFIFAVTIEAFGMVGGILLIVLYLVLIVRTFMLAARAKDDFGSYIIIGVAAMTLFHVVENIGMNLGVLPVTGIPLPFFSYGGSNLLTNMIAYGMVLSVDMRRTRWITKK